MPICHNKKIIFIHIPKNAGTYVERYFNLENNNDATSLYYKKYYPYEWKNYKKFCIVRNPITRFISTYNYFMMENKIKEYNHPFWKFNKTKIEVIQDVRLNDFFSNNKNKKYNEKNYIKKKFKEFRRNERIKNIFKGKNINEVVTLILDKRIIPDYQFYPQYFHVCNKNYDVLVDEIIKFENLNFNSFNIDFNKYPKVNKSIQGNENEMILDNNSIDKIYKHYEKDFILFNYKYPKFSYY